jgi:hypothetical protein
VPLEVRIAVPPPDRSAFAQRLLGSVHVAMRRSFRLFIACLFARSSLPGAPA